MSFSFNFQDLAEEPSIPIASTSETARAPFQTVSLATLIESLPARLSFSSITFNGGSVRRRDLFDVRFQALAEGEVELPDAESDLTRGQYEGGFKTWECSVDLLNVLHERKVQADQVLELGCGTAIPTCYLFEQLVRSRQPSKEVQPAKFHLQDYNLQVLQYVTLPNLLLAFVSASEDLPETGDFDIDPSLISAFTSFLEISQVELCFSYGDWASWQGEKYDLVLTSETIYEASNLPSLVNVLRNASKQDTRTLVACKRLYFGLTGGETVFRELLEKEGARVEDLGLANQGVGRTVLQVAFD